MNKLISITVMICVLISSILISVNAGVINPVGKTYSAEFEESLMEDWGIYKKDDWYSYGELYEYYSDDNLSDTPDWILVIGHLYMTGCLPCYGVLDIYYLETVEYYYPEEIPYFIYVPQEKKFYPLDEAYARCLEGIENIFTEYFIPRGKANILGDADNDDKLTIIDATLIQQALAGICELNDEYLAGYLAYGNDGKELEYISDFDRDGERTVLDATAIQLKLAGLQ